MTRKLVALISSLSLILAFSVLPAAADHDTSADQDPQLVSGNPSCASVYDSTEFVFEVKIEPVDDSPQPGGDPYSFGAFSGAIFVTVDEGAKTFDYEVTGNAAVIGVIVKGGPNANWYDYSPNSRTSDADLHAPSRGTGLYGLSHISFCMVPGLANPTLVTEASAAITIGGTIHDVATLSGATSDAGGSITFELYGPDDDDCSGTNLVAGNAAFTVTVNGNGSYQSGNFTPTAVGTYRWIANYSGDAKNNGTANGCNEANESVVVSLNQPQLSTAPWVIPQDDASLSALFGSGPFGSLTFELFDNADCDGDPVFTEVVPVTGNGTYSTSNTGDPSDNDGFMITADGTFYWVVTYSGNSENAEAVSACGAEVLEVDVSPNPAS